MKKIILLSLLMTQFFTSNVFADNELKTSDVFVTATRTPISKNNVIADTTTITEEEIERAGSSSLTDLLQRQPGIEIYNSGGQGKVSSLHIRGSESDHVVVLVDGLRVNQVTSGLTAFENIPLSQIEKIEIVRGPSSSLYGAGAIGGVIQIFTKKGISGFKPYVAMSYGRYDTKTAQAGIRAGNESTSYAINISSLSTEGFSAFKTNNPIFSDKDGYNNLSLSGSISHKFNQDNSIGLNFIKSSGNNKYDRKNQFDSTYDNFNYKNKMDTQVLGINFKTENKTIEKIESIQSYFYQLFTCLYSKTQEISEKSKMKTVYIDSKTSTLDFSATEEERIQIMDSGREAVKEFLKNKSIFTKRRNSI
jgi:vitamin B12 transporter